MEYELTRADLFLRTAHILDEEPPMTDSAITSTINFAIDFMLNDADGAQFCTAHRLVNFYGQAANQAYGNAQDLYEHCLAQRNKYITIVDERVDALPDDATCPACIAAARKDYIVHVKREVTLVQYGTVRVDQQRTAEAATEAIQANLARGDYYTLVGITWEALEEGEITREDDPQIDEEYDPEVD